MTLRIQDSVHTATATGHGPMNALDLCLRQCLSTVYPKIENVRLTDYKVRVLDSEERHRGQGARVGGMVRSPPKLGHGGRVRQRHRSKLAARWWTRSAWS